MAFCKVLAPTCLYNNGINSKDGNGTYKSDRQVICTVSGKLGEKKNHNPTNADLQSFNCFGNFGKTQVLVWQRSLQK